MDSSKKTLCLMNKMPKISRGILYAGSALLIAFILFWFMFPLFSYDSSWYITYLEYFSGDKPLSEWNPIRGFTFPLILWIAHLIKAGSWGIEIVLCLFYMLWGCYLFKTLRLVKKSCFNADLNICDSIALLVFALLNPILWGYFHFVLTECISVSMLTVYAYYAIKFFIHRKNRCASKYENIGFLFLSCFMTVLFWFLKQSFVANTVFLIIIFELLIWIDRLTLKRFLYTLLLISCVTGSLKGSIEVWKSAIGVEDIHTAFVANRLNMMRYIVVENRYNGGYISVMNDDWEVTEVFECEYENNYAGVLKFWSTCMTKYPGRVLRGYVDNYLLMADLYQNVYRDDVEEFSYEYGPVARDRIWETVSGQSTSGDISGEHVRLVRSRMINVFDAAKTMENNREILEENGNSTMFLGNYTNVNTPNFVTSFMTNKIYWTFAMIVNSILLIAAPFVCAVCFGFYIKRKKSAAGVFMALSFYAFFFVLMHVVEGMAIDRYAIPAYGVMLSVLIMLISIFIEKLRQNRYCRGNREESESTGEGGDD